MKTLLICPDPQTAVRSLSERQPLAALPVLGSSVLESWLIHLAELGSQQIVIYANDRVDWIHAIAGNGQRWGLKINVVWVPQDQIESTASGGPPIPSGSEKIPFDRIEMMDHLPNQPRNKMFDSYANWFLAVQERVPKALTAYRIGMQEIRAGVFVGQDSRISPSARLSAPCWIGNRVVVGASVVIGPKTVVEDRAIIKKGAHIATSIIGPDTLVGSDTEIKDSLATGERLINWSNGSSIRVRDAFLLSSLHAGQVKSDGRMLADIPQKAQETADTSLRKLVYTPVQENETIAIGT